MVKLEIKKADGSIYWTEHFITVAEKDKWLAEEMTRPYWNASYSLVVTVIPDTIPPAPSSEKVDARLVLKNLKAKNLSSSEIKQAVENLLIALF